MLGSSLPTKINLSEFESDLQVSTKLSLLRLRNVYGDAPQTMPVFAKQQRLSYLALLMTNKTDLIGDNLVI